MSQAGVDIWNKLCFEARQLATEVNLPGRDDEDRVKEGHALGSTLVFVTNGSVGTTSVSIWLSVTLRDAPGTIGFSASPAFVTGQGSTDVASDIFHMAETENGQYVLMVRGEAAENSNFAHHFLALSESLLRQRFPDVTFRA